jgi:hypothetical protein
MGAAFETIAGYYSSPSSTYEPLTMATGDSLTVRNFPATNPAYLMAMLRGDTTKGVTRVRSPLLHDNVKGIHVALAENPSNWGFPTPGVQQLKPQDTLILEATGNASGYDVGALSIYYTNLPGSAARLHNYGDFKGMIKNLVTVEVATTSTATPTAWTDTVITTTDNLLHANTDYAVIGLYCDVAISLVAFKGIDTGNLRMGASGRTSTFDTSEYFVKLSERSGLPCIPVFNAANAPSTYVSTIDVGDATSSNVTLFLAECGVNTGL